jgi:phosphatidate cytidylyltransferase
MTRLISAIALLVVVVGTIWFLPAYATSLLALIAAVLAFVEYAAIAAALGARMLPGSGVAVVFAFLAANGSAVAALVALAFIVIGAGALAAGKPGPQVLLDAAASMLPSIYIGLPLGSLAAVRAGFPRGREAVLLLLAVIVVSDSAQYYTGRAFGRRPLAPDVSPKKTVEGAIGGVLFATVTMALAGRYIFASAIWIMALLGAAISLLGMVGDLFESLLKRSAGFKDSSQLIPGHGGILDRIDSWLFAAPVYYFFVRLVS